MNKYSDNCGAIILTGGQSKRMGRPKAALTLGPWTLLQHLIQVVRVWVETLVVVRAPGQTFNCEDGDVRWACDAVVGEGPLRGLQAGLMAMPDHIEKVFVAGCDAPLLKSDLVGYLLGLQTDAEALVPFVDNFPQPLTAVYKTDILPVVTTLLDGGERRLRGLLEHLDTHLVLENEIQHIDPALHSFQNVNTPADYQRVLKIFASMP